MKNRKFKNKLNVIFLMYYLLFNYFELYSSRDNIIFFFEKNQITLKIYLFYLNNKYKLKLY